MWTAFVCPICQDGPNLGPVSGRDWSCSNGHALVDAVEVEVIPAAQLRGAVEALRWYADPANYRYGVVEETRPGQKARDAIEGA